MSSSRETARRTGRFRREGLREIHAAQTIPTLREAGRASGETPQVPQIGEHAAPLQGEAERVRVFQLREIRRRELPSPSELVESAVAGPRRDERDDRDAAVERELDRAAGPLDRLSGAGEWQSHEHERADG